VLDRLLFPREIRSGACPREDFQRSTRRRIIAKQDTPLRETVYDGGVFRPLMQETVVAVMDEEVGSLLSRELRQYGKRVPVNELQSGLQVLGNKPASVRVNVNGN
jgi:hypothetical protein